MTDKLEELLIGSEGTMIDQIDDYARSVAKQYAAHEVGRLLDCMADKDMQLNCSMWGFDRDTKGFCWNIGEDSGADKPSLYKYVGFSE